MADIAQLGIKVASTGITKATTELDRLASSAEKTESKIGRASAVLGKGLAAAAAAGVAAAGALTLIVNAQRDLIDSQAKLAQRLNTSFASLSNLDRAGQLAGVSMDQISTASRQLDINLGRAVQGSKAQTDALGRLRLSAQQLAAIPLDQRISTINQALRDNVPAAERAAVAAELFGARNAAAIQALDSDTIAEATRQAQLFGTALSDVDAAKVEMANDAFSTFSLAADGIAKQLTVALAPAIRAVGLAFLESAEEAGGLGNVVQNTVDKAVSAFAFVANAVDGVGRTFSLVAKGIVLGVLLVNEKLYGLADTIYNGPINAMNAFLRLANQIPGVNIGEVEFTRAGRSIQHSLMITRGAIAEARKDIQEGLLAPLAGQRLVAAFEEAKLSAQAAAEETVRTRERFDDLGESAADAAEAITAIGASAPAIAEVTDEVARQISAIERAATVWGMTADQVKLYDLQLAGATDTQREYAASILETIAAKERQTDIDREAVGIIESMRTEEQVIADSYARRRDIILAATFETEEARTAILERLEIERNDKLMAIEHARTMAVLQVNQQLFAGLAGLAQTFAGEQSTLYRAMFAVQQGFAVAQAMMNVPKSFSEAYAATVGIPVVGPALAPIAGATAAAAQVAQAAQIRSIAPSFDGGGFTGYGTRTGGIDGKGGFAAVLHPNETVIDHTKGQRVGGGQQVTNNFILQGRPDNRTQAQIAQQASRSQRMANSRFG